MLRTLPNIAETPPDVLEMTYLPSDGGVGSAIFVRYHTPVALWDSVVNSVVYCGGSTHSETFSVLHNAYGAFGRTIFVAYYKMHTI